MQILELGPAEVGNLIAFFDRLPAGDRTFIKEDVTDRALVEAWARDRGDSATGRWLAVEDGLVVGYLALQRLTGWSDHVAEIRLVVDPAARGRGIGRELARHALQTAIETGRGKVVVELVADQASAMRMFTDLGFTGEALLNDHIRDRDGQLRDLITLAHHVRDTQATMAALGLAEELA